MSQRHRAVHVSPAARELGTKAYGELLTQHNARAPRRARRGRRRRDRPAGRLDLRGLPERRALRSRRRSPRSARSGRQTWPEGAGGSCAHGPATPARPGAPRTGTSGSRSTGGADRRRRARRPGAALGDDGRGSSSTSCRRTSGSAISGRRRSRGSSVRRALPARDRGPRVGVPAAVGAARPRLRPVLLERDAELARITALLHAAPAGERAPRRDRGPTPGSARRACSPSCGRRGRGRDWTCSSARGGELEARASPSASCASSFEAALAPARTARARCSPAPRRSPSAALRRARCEAPRRRGGHLLRGPARPLLAHAATSPPSGRCVLAIDDLHWCDAPSLRWLAYLARRLEGLPMLARRRRCARPSRRPSERSLDRVRLRPGDRLDPARGAAERRRGRALVERARSARTPTPVLRRLPRRDRREPAPALGSCSTRSPPTACQPDARERRDASASSARRRSCARSGCGSRGSRRSAAARARRRRARRRRRASARSPRSPA